MSDKDKVALTIKDYIDGHLSEKLQLDKIAEITGYSKFHVSRIFRESMGITVHQYIKRRRLCEAARQLINTNNSIVDIALAHGYDTQQAFNLAFKRQYEEAPLYYRKRGELKQINDYIIRTEPQRKNVITSGAAAYKGVMAA